MARTTRTNSKGQPAAQGDALTVTAADLRNAPWRTAASWVNDAAAQVSAADALVAAGLDWTVEHTELSASVITEQGVTSVPVPDKRATTRINRDGSASVLGITSPTYTIVQNTQSADLIDGITYEAGAIIDSAGEIGGGKRIYVAAKMPETVNVAGRDPVDTFLVITNGHDGTHGLSCEIKHLRLLCTNGMTGWRTSDRVTLRHTSRMDVRVQQIRDTLRLVYAEATQFAAFADDLALTQMTDNEFWAIVSDIFPDDEDATERQRNANQRNRDAVWGIYEGPTQDNIRGTAWGAYQAFIEYAEWGRSVRANGRDADIARAERQLLGASDRITARALALITA
jgi:phage/plasmid-like protein (TIGR03299 family)